MIEVLTIGEPMGLLVAEEVKPLKDVEHFTRYVCGAEVNFAVGLARLEHGVAYVSKIGNDPFGKHIKDFLLENKIDNCYVGYDDDHMTGMQLKAKVESGDPEVVNFRKNTAFSNLSANDIKNIDWTTLKHMHVTGIPPALSLSCRETIYKLMDIAREKGIRISFDPNLRPALWKDKAEMVRVINELAAKADLVLPGVSEGKILAGTDDPEAIADFYLKKGVKTVIVKVGAKGAFVKTQDDKFMSPGFKVEKVIDTVGAGDGFAVGVVSALLEGQTLKDAVHRGAAVGALAVMSPGDNEGLPTRAGLKKFMEA
jgi:2-dehydro-3-deoxygluconokinase